LLWLSSQTINSDIEVSVPTTVGATVSLSNIHGASQITGLDVKTKKEGDKTIKYTGDGSGTIHLETVNGDLLLKGM
jgi:DUF4097 and DUF4098 domain-containing protein YvlB